MAVPSTGMKTLFFFPNPFPIKHFLSDLSFAVTGDLHGVHENGALERLSSLSS